MNCFAEVLMASGLKASDLIGQGSRSTTVGRMLFYSVLCVGLTSPAIFQKRMFKTS